MRRKILATVICVGCAGSHALAAGISSTRLIGITGNQGAGNDETLWEINPQTGGLTLIIQLPFVPDTDAIGFNPEDSLLYRTSGASTYSNNPLSNGYRDNHYMQTVDVLSGSLEQTAIFNANSEQFGLPAPRPDWVLPAERRTDEQTGNEFRISGPNEYHSLRDLVWSSADHLFFGADEDGIFTLTADGHSTFIADPGGQPKGIAFANIEGERVLFLSDRDNASLWRIDPVTAQHIGDPVYIKDPHLADTYVNGVLSLVEDPESGMLFGINKTPSAFNRELLLINPITGDTSAVPLGTYMADLALITIPSEWNVDSDGSWGTPGNWSGPIPDSTGTKANFLGIITQGRTVSMDGDRIVGGLNFDNANAYTIVSGSGGTLILNNNGLRVGVNVFQGNHRIEAPVGAVDDTLVTVTAGSLTLAGGIQSASLKVLTKAGDGELGTKFIRGGSLEIQSGVVRILPDGTDGGTSIVESLTIAGGATLDLSDNDFIAQGNSSTSVALYFDITAQIANGRNDGATLWSGTGMTSSTAALEGTGRVGLGVILNADGNGDPIFTEFSGQAVDANAVLVKYTWSGDADLSGAVDADDYFRIDSGFAIGLPGWYFGDFDYSGTTDADDYFLIDSNFVGQTGPLGAVAVPEPGILGAVVLAFGAIGRRRKRGK